MKLQSILPLLPLLLTLRVTGFVIDGGVEILFPEAVRFSANLTIPATQLTSVSLTITPEGHKPISVLINPIEWALVYWEPKARLVYNWHIPIDDPLPLFSSIAYQWSFTSSDGSVGTLTDSFTFSDPRIEWARSVDAENHFSLAMPKSLNPLIDSLGEVNALLTRNTGTPLHENVILYNGGITPDCVPFAQDPNRQVVVSKNDPQIHVFCTHGIADAVFKDYRLLELPNGGNAEDYIVGTLVRDAYTSLWQDKSVPAWFIDGLVQFYAPTPKNAQLTPVQQAARSGSLFSLQAMQTAQPAALWRAQSFGMVLYIANQLTPQGLFELARVDAADFSTAYQAAMGAPMTALIPAWQQWIFTTDAASVYGITPYQAPTELPTLTPTASDTLTPSPTFTLTPSITPTASNTPFGVRTYIAPPTITPSNTPPPSPSVTPRPPGSLPTAVPPPPALETAISQPAFQAGVGTFLVLLLLLLVFLLFRLGNRR